MNETDRQVAKLSVEQIVDLIRNNRNDLVKSLLNDDKLNSYFLEHCKKELSAVKREFLKRDLKELLIAPVDLVHYSKLITQVRDGGVFSGAERNSDFFVADLNRIIKKYSI